MSRKNEFQIKNVQTSVLGFPVGESSYTEDMSTLGAVTDIQIHDPFSQGAIHVSAQVVSSGLTGTLDGTVDLIESNDGLNWNLMSHQTTLDTVSKSAILKESDFCCKFLGIRITKGQITAGAVKIILLAKQR